MAAAYDVVSVHKVNMVGAVLWYLKGRVLKSQNVKPGEVATFDRIVPILRCLDRIFGPPFGQSLAAVGCLR
jgi:hypothetical protein